jgi:acyl-CoA thioesterase I
MLGFAAARLKRCESGSYRAAKALVHIGVVVASIFTAAVNNSIAAGDRPVRIVALGDSLTAGFGLPAQAAFPTKLERALKGKGYAVEIVNAGVSGDTASRGLARLEWSVPENTDAVIVELGANDMLLGINPAVTRKALAEIIRRLTERNISVLLAGMRAAPNLGQPYASEFERIYADLAREHDLVFYPFFLDGIAAQSKFNLQDGLHPNPGGIDAIVARILPQVEELIARVKGQR